jgi:hypothetical protein
MSQKDQCWNSTREKVASMSPDPDAHGYAGPSAAPDSVQGYADRRNSADR